MHIKTVRLSLNCGRNRSACKRHDCFGNTLSSSSRPQEGQLQILCDRFDANLICLLEEESIACETKTKLQNEKEQEQKKSKPCKNGSAAASNTTEADLQSLWGNEASKVHSYGFVYGRNSRTFNLPKFCLVRDGPKRCFGSKRSGAIDQALLKFHNIVANDPN